MELVKDKFLGGKLTLKQPKVGYRAAMDPVLLAASVPSLSKGNILDLGCGIGTALFCYGTRVQGPDLCGLEINADIAEVARQNADQNKFMGRVQILTGDILNIPKELEPNSFDQVFANPPYMDQASGMVSPDQHRDQSNREGQARLEDWVSVALKLTRPKGGISFIHRADRTHDIIRAMTKKAGEITIIPLWPRQGEAAKRVIIRARKGVKGGTILHPGIVLHGPSQEAHDRYTKQAEAILRDGQAIS